MDERFYKELDASSREQQGKSTRQLLKEFAIREMPQMLRVLNKNRRHAPSDSDESVDDKDQQLSERWVKIENPSYSLVNKIWEEWSDTIHQGPRTGVIPISMDEPGAEKVLLVMHRKCGRYNYSFPKGKPNPGETLNSAGFREFKEELTLNMYIDESQGMFITKHPHIGPRKRQRSRVQHYTIIKFSEDIQCRPARKEIVAIEWISVYLLPCCRRCKVCRSRKAADGSELINYHMVTCPDIHGCNSTIPDIVFFIDATNQNCNAFDKYE